MTLPLIFRNAQRLIHTHTHTYTYTHTHTFALI